MSKEPNIDFISDPTLLKVYNIHNDVIKYILNIDNEHIITAGDELKIWE